jgi:endogenous inhibitor of DNA gyrase (YacG/DUF329 family)
MIARCPICKREFESPAGEGEGGFFPFCSERCKLIDLGRWLGGRYQIPLERDEESATARRPRGEAGEEH